jgi:twitching motility protein PilI
MQQTDDLRALRDQPFELLREMERRGLRAAAQSADSTSDELVGLAFRLGEDSFVCSREDAREVLVYPDTMTRIPAAKPWVIGLANVRGQLLPVIDLKAFLGGAVTRPGRDTRLITVNHRDIPAGLVVDDVLGFRRFRGNERSDEVPPQTLRCERYLEGSRRQDAEMLPVFNLTRLVESRQFLHAGLMDN